MYIHEYIYRGRPYICVYIYIYVYVFMLIHTYRKYVDGLGPWHDCFRSFSTFWRFRDLGFI